MYMKWILIALALFFLYKLLTGDKGQKQKEDAKAKERKIATGEMVKDPICGTYVDKAESISVRDGKNAYHFCSYECRKKFLDELENSGREIPQYTKEDE